MRDLNDGGCEVGFEVRETVAESCPAALNERGTSEFSDRQDNLSSRTRYIPNIFMPRKMIIVNITKMIIPSTSFFSIL